MSIRFFNIEIDNLGSVICAITSIMLIAAAIILLIELGEYAIRQIMYLF